MAPKQMLSDFWCHFGVPKSFKFELEFDLKNAPSWIDKLSLVEASGGAFGLDFGLILGSILGSRAPYAIFFAKIGTALQREHDFRGSGGPKKLPKTTPSGNPAPNPSWKAPGSILARF